MNDAITEEAPIEIIIELNKIIVGKNISKQTIMRRLALWIRWFG
jgi:hypothetical protein